MRSLARFLFALASFLCCVSASAETRLIFPRLVFQQGRFSGIAVANPTSASAQIPLTAYNPDGSLLSGNGVTKPGTDTIAAGAQYAKVTPEIFTPPDSIINSATPQDENEVKSAWIAALVSFVSGTAAPASQVISEEPALRKNSQVPGRAESVRLLQTFRVVYVHSGTIYLTTEAMRTALERQPEFSIWNLAVANKREEAEVTIEVTRPFMTFDWEYNLVHQKTGIVLGSGKVVAWDGKAAAPKIAAEILRKIKAARPMPLEADPTQLLQTFRTLFIRSDTIYLKAEVMQQSIDRRPEYSAWGLSVVKTQDTADVVIEVTRPFLTFDWKYNIIHRKTAVRLGSGKVVAWDGKTAATQLTAEITKQIQIVRPLPASAEYSKKGEPLAGEDAANGNNFAAKTQLGTPLTLTVNQNRIIGHKNIGNC